MKKLFTNPKALVALAAGIIGPQVINISMCQPPDPPPPPEGLPLTGASIAILILACVGYGVYDIYKKNYKNKKATA